MARGKYEQWLKPEKLEQVTNWYANGLIDKEVAANMGVTAKTLYEWQNRFGEFSEAVKKGRELQRPVMENVMFSRAKGGLKVTETVEEFRGELKDGEPWNGTIVKRTVTKELPPEPGLLMFYHKNKSGYRSEPETTVNVDVAPTFVYERGANDR